MQRFILSLLLFTFFASSWPSSAKLISLDGTDNTRDLGGIPTKDGRVVRKGAIYRSDDLASLSAADLEVVRTWKLAVVTDLRSEQEINASPNRLPLQEPAIRIQRLAINNLSLDIQALGQQVFSGELAGEPLTSLLQRAHYVTNEDLRWEFGRWIRSLGSKNSIPQVFHCTAGKDRTGVAAALLLLTLGVDRPTIRRDFLRSNHYLEEKTRKTLDNIRQRNPNADLDNLQKIIGVDSTSLDDLFAAIDSSYASIDEFVFQGLQISPPQRARLRDNLTANPLAEGRQLTTAEIGKVFSGTRDETRVVDANGTLATNHWHADGQFVNEWANHRSSGRVTGHWSSRDDQRCVLIEAGLPETPHERCSPIYYFEDQYFSVNADGSIHGIHIPIKTDESGQVPEIHSTAPDQRPL